MPATRTNQIPSVVGLRIVLRDIEPPIWRLLDVPESITLIKLADAILNAMGWWGYHLSEYRFGTVTYGDPDPDSDGGREVRDLRRVRLASVMPAIGERFEFHYDFGDGWVHDLVVEAVTAPQRRSTYPWVVAGERACPPEDVGGPAGYADFLVAIADVSNPAHAELLDWVGGEFDPEWYDIDGVNEAFELDPLPLS